MNAVDVENLTHTYSSGRTALQGVSFSVQEGEIFGLLGPNGGGKSTTFHILSTFLRPTGGLARIMGHEVTAEPSLVRRQLGVVFQAPGLDKKLTIWENLSHQGHLYGLTGETLRARAATILGRISLLDRKDEIVETLSGGMKRRVEVAKGLLHHPKVLLMDEPSTGLDPGARRDLWQYLGELRTKEKITVVVTTHLMEEAEKCDRVAILNEGKLVALGTPAALKHEIGGDIISVEAAEPEALAQEISKQFGVSCQVMGRSIRIEKDHGHEFVPPLAGAFAAKIQSIRVGKPTLEDVFIARTGHKFWDKETS